ncbi:hypothetical protein E4H12_15640 [Candidatus Thorarchaeota archaeon]|nr:MAG: hypothetical protein E4H12_15640 [Candidatus Thorarchaeota archaeon]
MKTCSHCERDKSLEEFDKKATNPDGLQRYCKPCRKEIAAKYYKRSRKEIIAKSLARSRAGAQKFKELKGTLQCFFCGEDEAVCLEFHHRDPAEKDFTVSYAVRHYGWELLLKEIEKCTVVCSNCHKKLHAGLLKDDGGIV